MYLSQKSRPMEFYMEAGRDMIIDTHNNGGLLTQHHQRHNQQQAQQMMITESSGEDHEVKAVPRRRAETWVQKETQCLINLRRELDELFNTSKSNKHLWEQISAKMAEKGYDRSPSMCTDKWRNLLKEFKKAKHRNTGDGVSAKSSYYYDELEEFYRGRKRNVRQKNYVTSRVDTYIQFSDKGIDDASIPFRPVEDSGRSTPNLERDLDHDGHPLGICEAEAVAANGVPPWNWRENPGSGGEPESAYSGRVISVKWGECTKRIGIDGSSEAIKEAIKSAFGLRTSRAFWLEDENEIVRSLDRDMPLGNYTLHLDKGLTIKICLYDDPNHLPLHTEEKTFYSEDDYRDFLSRRGWIGLKDLSCYKNVESMDDLHPGEMYQGLRMLGN
ncbi:hypothetical protein L1049_027606 [Liquidambar formosana]|uniref:Myb-like domain-containing protein n=1 Tax=Liquidambar formosana TaxID=63359 RepID=A0AAP0WVL5_LIQFO